MKKIRCTNVFLITLFSLNFFMSISWADKPKESHGLTVVSVSTGGSNVRQPCSKNSMANCLVTLSVASGLPGSVIIQNNSNVTVFNIKADLPYSFFDVTQNYSFCTSVVAGGSCTLSFTPGATTHPVETLPVYGDESKIVYFDLRVDP